MKLIAILVVLVLAGWAGTGHGCASGSGGASGEAGGGPPGGGGGGSGAGGGGAAYVAGCPAAAPVSGKPCAPSGRTCTYGDAPRGECRDRATCVEGAWAVRAGACAPASDAGTCPAAPPTAEACTQSDQLCAYAGGVECMCAGGAGWQCDTPRSPGPGCPPTPPNAGTPCTGAAPLCTYACGLLTANALFAQCAADGAWTWALMPCANTNRIKVPPSPHPPASGRATSPRLRGER